MRTRRAAALLLAVALTSALPRSAVSGDFARDEQVLQAAANKTALALNVQRVALEKKILEHLTGKTPSAFAELKKTLEGIKSGLAAATDIPAEARAALADLLLRDEKMLMGGAALARGAARMDPKIEQIFRAVADNHQASAVAAVSDAVSGLLKVAAAKDPAAADRLFDNKAQLRASLGDDPAAAANLQAVIAEFGQKDPIVYTQPNDPGYQRTNAAKFSHKASIPALAPAPEAAVAPKTDQAESPAVQHCLDAVDGAMLPVGVLCRMGTYGPAAASVAAGALDAVKQQFSASGLLMNAAFILMGVLMGLATGGWAVVLKIVVAVGMTGWAIWKLRPTVMKILKDLWNSAEGSRERYDAIRQLTALVGGIVIMGLLAALGGKYAPGAASGLEGALKGLAEKVPLASKIPGGESFMGALGKIAHPPVKIPPPLTGAAHLSGKIPPVAVQSAERSYLMSIEETGGATAKGAELTAKLEKAATERLNREITPGQSPTVAKAQSLLKDVLNEQHELVKEHAARNPSEAAPQVNSSLGLVAKDAAGNSILVSAKAGEGGVFLRRAGGAPMEINPEPELAALKRLRTLKQDLGQNGIKASDVVAAQDIEAADALAETAKSDPVFEKMLAEARARKHGIDLLEYKRRLAAEPEPAGVAEAPRTSPLRRYASLKNALKAKGVAATDVISYKNIEAADALAGLAKSDAVFDELLGEARSGNHGIDLLEYKARVAAKPPGGALGSPDFITPEIRTSPLKPNDVVFAASENLRENVPSAHEELGPLARSRPGRYLRSLFKTDRLSEEPVAGESAPKGLAGLKIPKAGGRGPMAWPAFAGISSSALIAEHNAPQVPEEDSNKKVPEKNKTNDTSGDKNGRKTDDAVDEVAAGEGGGGSGGENKEKTGGGSGDGAGGTSSTAVNLPPPGGGGGGGGAGSGAGGDHATKGPKPPMPGGFGGGGGGGGGAGGGGSGGGGGGGGSTADNLTPNGGAASAPAPAAGQISAAAPSGARPAPFVSPALAGVPAGAAHHGGSSGLDGGHSDPIAARFDGSPDRPRRGATAAADSMRGLGAGDSGGLPHLTPREWSAKPPPAAADAALQDKTAASYAASPASGAATPGPAAKTADEDYNYTYLAPAKHKYELPTDRPKDASDNRYLLDLGLQSAAALAAIYLLYHSDAGYLLGMTRRRKKTGGEG